MGIVGIRATCSKIIVPSECTWLSSCIKCLYLLAVLQYMPNFMSLVVHVFRWFSLCWRSNHMGTWRLFIQSPITPGTNQLLFLRRKVNFPWRMAGLWPKFPGICTLYLYPDLSMQGLAKGFRQYICHCHFKHLLDHVAQVAENFAWQSSFL